jgi:hypothetical protein
MPAQVPVHVLQEVHRRRLVQRRRVGAHAQHVWARQLVRRVDVQVSGESCLTIICCKHD